MVQLPWQIFWQFPQKLNGHEHYTDDPAIELLATIPESWRLMFRWKPGYEYLQHLHSLQTKLEATQTVLQWTDGYKNCSPSTPKSVSCCLVTKLCLTLLQLHGLQPTRLLCLWDFPSKKTEWVAISFSNHRLLPSNTKEQPTDTCYDPHKSPEN